MGFLKSFLAIYFLFLPAFIWAQEAEVALDPVTVTATVQPTSVSQTGRNVVVLDGTRFQKLPVNSIDELLRYVPGIEVQARGPMGTQSDFVLRGGTFQQVLVVLDGLRLNDPNTGHFSSYIPIAPTKIERIEILKGASSALYGSDAVGGVIHIITKSFAAKKGMGISKSLSARVTGGAYNLHNANIGGFYQNGKTTVAGGFLTNNSDGALQRGTRGFFNLHTASLSVNRYLGDSWQLTARTSLDSRKFGAQNYYTTSPADTATEKVATFWNQLQLRYEKAKDKFSLQAGYKNVEDQFKFNNASAANNNLSKLFQTRAVYERNFFKTAYLTTGLHFQNRAIHSNDRGNHTINQAAAFALWQQRVGTSFFVSPALRLDWDSRSGSELVPQLALAYRAGSVSLRGSAGKTIRQADFTERYNNYNKALVPNLNRVGNPALVAETSFSYEGGVDVVFAKNLKLATTYFQRDYSDLIDFALTHYSQMPRRENLSPTGTYFFAQNIASVTTKGVEADVTFSKNVKAGHQLFSTVGLVYASSTSAEAAPSLYISSHAKFLTNLSFIYSAPRWSVSTTALYKQRNPQQAAAIKANVSKDYFVMHAKAEAYLIAKKLSVQIQVDNILNRTYSDLLGAQMPPRWFMAGVQLSL